MLAPLSRGALVVVLAALVVPLFLGGSATAATPTEGVIGPASGSNTAWDFASVGPGVSAGGTTETTNQCVPVYCDAYALTVTLPDTSRSVLGLPDRTIAASRPVLPVPIPSAKPFTPSPVALPMS